MKERLKILITVKTYPYPSPKYEELVCTAGISDKGEFIRLYPINFRDQPYSSQYKKYQWIEVDAKKHTGRDFRKESFRPDCNSLTILGEPIGPENGTWSTRAKIVLPLASDSVEVLRDRQDEDDTSLGIVKPKKVHDLIAEPTEREWKASCLNELKQARLWDDRTVSKEPPRKVPYTFRYVFECNDSRCTGHTMMNEDWELGAFYWRNIDQGMTEKQAIEAVRKKFFDQICGQDRETYFYLGTVLKHPKSWVVIGTFWPKKSKRVDPNQQSLF